MQRSTQHPRRRAWLRRLIVVAVLAAAVGALLSQTVFAQTSYIITDGDRVTVHRSYSSDPYEVLTEAGIELEEEDTYETGYADGMNQITVRRMQMVTVINRGAQSVIGTYGETTGSLLARMGITPGTGDTLSCSSETQTYDGMTVELVHTETRIEEEDTTVPYPVNYYEDPDLEPGAEIVLVAGQNGLTHVKSEVTYRNGKEVSRVIVQETVKTKPVTQLVIRGVDRTIMEQPADPEPAEQAAPDASSGTASGSSSSGSSSSGGSRYDGSAETDGNVIMTSSGESYTYVDVMTCSATAYTCEGYYRIMDYKRLFIFQRTHRRISAVQRIAYLHRIFLRIQYHFHFPGFQQPSSQFNFISQRKSIDSSCLQLWNMRIHTWFEILPVPFLLLCPCHLGNRQQTWKNHVFQLFLIIHKFSPSTALYSHHIFHFLRTNPLHAIRLKLFSLYQLLIVKSSY